jgi:exonuclease III
MDYFLTSNNGIELIDTQYHAQIEGSDHCPVSLEFLIPRNLKRKATEKL